MHLSGHFRIRVSRIPMFLHGCANANLLMIHSTFLIFSPILGGVDSRTPPGKDGPMPALYTHDEIATEAGFIAVVQRLPRPVPHDLLPVYRRLRAFGLRR